MAYMIVQTLTRCTLLQYLIWVSTVCYGPICGTEGIDGLIALTLLHLEWQKLHRILATLSAIGLRFTD